MTVTAAPRAVMEGGHPALMDPFENLHTLCYLFAQALCFMAKRYFTFSSSPGTPVHHPPPHHLHHAYSVLRLICGLSQTEKALYSHGHALQKRPKGKMNCKAAHLLDLWSGSQRWRCAAFPSQS